MHFLHTDKKHVFQLNNFVEKDIWKLILQSGLMLNEVNIAESVNKSNEVPCYIF